jgi:hypothetical protein
MSAEIFLVCNDGRSNKFYHIEVIRPRISEPGKIIKSYGKIGDNRNNARGGTTLFNDSESVMWRNEIAYFIETKLKKGYKLKEVVSPETVNGVPKRDFDAASRIGGITILSTQSVVAATYLFDEGRDYRASSTTAPLQSPQPIRVKPLEDVLVTFDVGQACPVW